MEFVEDSDFKAHLNFDPKALVVMAFRSISPAGADGRGSIRFWNYRTNEILFNLNIESEVTNMVYFPRFKKIYCACWNGSIFAIESAASKSATEGAESSEACMSNEFKVVNAFQKNEELVFDMD